MWFRTSCLNQGSRFGTPHGRTRRPICVLPDGEDLLTDAIFRPDRSARWAQQFCCNADLGLCCADGRLCCGDHCCFGLLAECCGSGCCLSGSYCANPAIGKCCGDGKSYCGVECCSGPHGSRRGLMKVSPCRACTWATACGGTRTTYSKKGKSRAGSLLQDVAPPLVGGADRRSTSPTRGDGTWRSGPPFYVAHKG